MTIIQQHSIIVYKNYKTKRQPTSTTLWPLKTDGKKTIINVKQCLASEQIENSSTNNGWTNHCLSSDIDDIQLNSTAIIICFFIYCCKVLESSVLRMNLNLLKFIETTSVLIILRREWLVTYCCKCVVKWLLMEHRLNINYVVSLNTRLFKDIYDKL